MKNFRTFLIPLLTGMIISQGTSYAARADEPKCSSDDDLAQMGFVIHSETEFEAVEARLTQLLAAHPERFTALESTDFWSTSAREWMKLEDFDDSTTPAEFMRGDILKLTLLGTSHGIELRWFEGGQRHLVYREAPCAANLIPWADNSLY